MLFAYGLVVARRARSSSTGGIPLTRAIYEENRETIVHGLEKAPDAFLGLFKGENTGKMLVKL